MPAFRRSHLHGRQAIPSHHPFFLLSIMLFMWCLFDGVMSYVTPLILETSLGSATLMGIFIASSSFFGALFDILSLKIFPSTHYRRMFLYMFILSALFPLFLGIAKVPLTFLIAMGIWGIYYDVKNFGIFDFIGRYTPENEHAYRFSLINFTKSAGYFIAPLLAGILLLEFHEQVPFFIVYITLFASFILYLFFIARTKKLKPIVPERKYVPLIFRVELSTLRTISLFIIAPLIITLLINGIDAVFWTIGPRYSQELSNTIVGEGLLVSAYMLPTLLGSFMVMPLVKLFGKKRAAILSLFLGSLLLISISIVPQGFVVVGIVFLSSLLLSVAWPSINGAYADYIAESSRYEKEIESLEDFATNAGYIVGPILAGVLADALGSAGAISTIGAVSAATAFILFFITPKSITLPKNINSSS